MKVSMITSRCAARMASNTRGKNSSPFSSSATRLPLAPARAHRSISAASGAWSDRCDQGRARQHHRRVDARRCARRCGRAAAAESAPGRCCADAAVGLHEHLAQAGALARGCVRAAAPVVEVAGHDQRRVGRHLVADDLAQQRRAAGAGATSVRPEVHADRVHVERLAGQPQHAMQQAALLGAVDRDVVVLVVHDRETSTAPRCRDGRADRPRCGRRRTAARSRRPEIRSAAPPASRPPRLNGRVGALHFLQEDHVGAHRAHRLAQLGQDEAAVQDGEALVGVHREHAQGHRCEMVH